MSSSIGVISVLKHHLHLIHEKCIIIANENRNYEAFLRIIPIMFGNFSAGSSRARNENNNNIII